MNKQKIKEELPIFIEHLMVILLGAFLFYINFFQ